MGGQTNRGLENGFVVKRSFDAQYSLLLQKTHSLAGCCSMEMPHLGTRIIMHRKRQEYANIGITRIKRPTFATRSASASMKEGTWKRRGPKQGSHAPSLWTGLNSQQTSSSILCLPARQLDQAMEAVIVDSTARCQDPEIKGRNRDRPNQISEAAIVDNEKGVLLRRICVATARCLQATIKRQ